MGKSGKHWGEKIYVDDVVFLENMGRLMKIGKWECFHPLIYGKYWKFGGLVTRAPIYIYKNGEIGDGL